ncbi:MAG: aminoglycoside phosphotransferase family protein [Bacteroidaceae bacterium]|nr:aminoglycoside phosphotransferase family protein [Bacteroidaceae bacterium]
MNQNLSSIVDQFAIRGTVAEIKPLGEGLINDTLLVKTAEADAPNYVLQRVNTNVFPDVDMLMGNIRAVTTHIRQKLEARGETDIDRKVLTFVPLKSDPTKLYTLAPLSSPEGDTAPKTADNDGKEAPSGAVGGATSPWRLMVFINDAITKQAVNPESSEAAGEAFGQFQAMLADIPVQLGETIKDFHNMEFRIQQLKEVIQKDPAGRVKSVQPIIDELFSYAEEMTLAERLGREGKLPKRICHCDTKVNNMMFDKNDRVLCVIDLDTVMPNFIFSDYGDFLRTAANFTAEDDPDLSKVGFNMDIFKAFTRGYLRSAKSFLTPLEIQLLPYAATLFPYMQAVRFLWDYISGDKYWKCRYPEHNLDRVRNQLALFKSAYALKQEMADFIAQQ